jgi:hypothetical protein
MFKGTPSNAGVFDLAELRQQRDIAKATYEKLRSAVFALESLQPPTVSSTARPDYRGAITQVLNDGAALEVKQINQRLTRLGRAITTTDPYRTVYKVLRAHADVFERQGSKWRLKKASGG